MPETIKPDQIANTAVQRTTTPHREFCGGGGLGPMARIPNFGLAVFRAVAFFPPGFFSGAFLFVDFFTIRLSCVCRQFTKSDFDVTRLV